MTMSYIAVGSVMLGMAGPTMMARALYSDCHAMLANCLGTQRCRVPELRVIIRAYLMASWPCLRAAATSSCSSATWRSSGSLLSDLAASISLHIRHTSGQDQNPE